ncbi:hypothetical protein BDP67DRAFT_485923 [Colletotrichum lupini]|nr:hypothetical protein BDP67DRAFT_485923 [Colletotrichum lupini]
MSGNTLYGSGSHGRCSHGDVPGKFGDPCSTNVRGLTFRYKQGDKGGTTRGRGACADAGRRFGDEGLGSGHFSETEEGRMARVGAFDIESDVNPACLSTTPWVSKIGPLLAHLARPQLFRSCIWSASDYSRRQQGPANRFLGGTGGTRCGGRDGTGMHPADWHDDEEMRHEISGSQGT